jgi:hypothetical protein
MSDGDLRRMPPSPNGPGNTTFRMVAGIPTAQPAAAGPSATPMFTLRCRGLPKLIEIRRVLRPHRRGRFLDLSDLIGRKTFAVPQPNADQILEGHTELVIADLFLGEFDVLLRPSGREVLEQESESSGQAVRTVSGLARLSAVQSSGGLSAQPGGHRRDGTVDDSVQTLAEALLAGSRGVAAGITRAVRAGAAAEPAMILASLVFPTRTV